MQEQVNTKIGLEIHVPLNTKRKLFCNCPTNYYEVEKPNTNTCEVCTGMPGVKPFPINSDALKTAVMVAKLLNCKIIHANKFVKRKHYNYPDLPSGYQRTSEPVGEAGNLEGVGIWEIHFEEDPGRYDLQTGRVDYNRSGVPLIEIVTAPDMKSPDEVRNFLKTLINLLKYTGRIIEVGGVMRADVNISIEGGNRAEIKNINSIKGAYKAINYEIMRQKNIMKRGAKVTQETRGFNEKSMITFPMRTKETQDDYRYIPDPDIPPLYFEQDYIDGIELPETPQSRKERLINDFKISEKYAQTMIRDKDIADLFEEVIGENVNPELAAQWISQEVNRQLNYRTAELEDTKLNSKVIIELLSLLQNKEITESVGKKLLERVIDSGESPEKIVKDEGLVKVSGSDKLSEVVSEVISENDNAVNDYKSGNKTTLNFHMGKVMQKMRGAAEAKTVISLLKEKLD